MLVRAFQIKVCLGIFAIALARHKGVGTARIEPDVENVFNLLIFGRIIGIAEEEFGVIGEPSIRPARAHGRQDALIHGFILQDGGGVLVDEHDQRHAPGALAADQPVWPLAHHRGDAVRACFIAPIGRGNLGHRHIAQGLTPQMLNRLVHCDEPLRRVAIDQGRFRAPRVGILVGEAATRQQPASLDQSRNHRAISWAFFTGLFAFQLQNRQAFKARRFLGVAAIGIHGERNVGLG